MLTLRAEIAACLIAVSLLGLLVGWMLQRALSSRRFQEAEASWETRHAELERRSEQDIANMEDRLQAFARDFKALKEENRQLSESLSEKATNNRSSQGESREAARLRDESAGRSRDTNDNARESERKDEGTSEHSSDRSLKRTNERAGERTQERAQERQSARATEQAFDSASGRYPERASKPALEGAYDREIERAPEQASERPLERPLEQAPGRASGRVSGRVSGRKAMGFDTRSATRDQPEDELEPRRVASRPATEEDALDETVRMDPDERPFALATHRTAAPPRREGPVMMGRTLDRTLDTGLLDFEESTIAMDDDARLQARRDLDRGARKN